MKDGWWYQPRSRGQVCRFVGGAAVIALAVGSLFLWLAVVLAV